MKPLTTKQRAVLDYLRACEYPPTYAEIALHFGCSRPHAWRTVLMLQERGFIAAKGSTSRAIRLTGKTEPDPAKMAQALREVINLVSAGTIDSDAGTIIDICNAGLA